MSAELTNHLGYEKNDPADYHSGNSRNGVTFKTLKGDFGEMLIETPRDRNGSFEPQIIKKHQTRFDGFDDKILSMYARGMTTRDEVALKLIYLALWNVIQKWDTVQGWKQALNHFQMLWGDRIQAALNR